MAKDGDGVLRHEVGVVEAVDELVLLIGALNFSSPRAPLVHVDDLVHEHYSQRVWGLEGGEQHR